MGRVIRYITKAYFTIYFLARVPNSGRDIDIFEYCKYVMGTFEFHKLLNMNLVYLLLVVTMETIPGLLQNGNEINCI